MKKKNLLKNAMRYSAMYRIPIWNPFAGVQELLLAWHGGGLSCGSFVATA
ncbi:unnamed protein product, partial [Linum tenue]